MSLHCDPQYAKFDASLHVCSAFMLVSTPHCSNALFTTDEYSCSFTRRYQTLFLLVLYGYCEDLAEIRSGKKFFSKRDKINFVIVCVAHIYMKSWVKISAQPHTTICISSWIEKTMTKTIHCHGKTDLFYNSMGLCGNFTEKLITRAF